MAELLENAAAYLKKTLRLAFKNVISNIGQYACFFAAIAIIQTIFATLTVILYNNDRTEWQRVTEEFDYHIALYSLTEDQKLAIENGLPGWSRTYEDVRITEHYNAYKARSYYDVYIVFKGNDFEEVNEVYKTVFRQRHLGMIKDADPQNPVEYVTTPLMNFRENLFVNRLIYAASMVVTGVLSVFLLVILYNIRINHYKFVYGIYMSFGADFKKLFETSFWEMFSIGIMTFLPATLVSVIISWVLLAVHKIPFSCPVWTLLLAGLYGLIVILVSVMFPMRIMSMRAPMTLIAAEDNSNLVVSPRRSFRIFGSKFPLRYEMFSAWRFRRYNLRLLLSAVIFTSLFICGLYVAEITRVIVAKPAPEYELDISKVEYQDRMRDELYDTEGIVHVGKTASRDAVDLKSHMRVRAEYMAPFGNLVIPDEEGEYRVAGDLQYRTIDEDTVTELSKYKYDGDLSAPLHDDGYVVIADSIGNERKFDYKVGDKIEIAEFVKYTGSIDGLLSGKALLREQVEKGVFNYREYTIGAIVYDIPTLLMPIYFSDAAFEDVTGNELRFDTINVYADPTLSPKETAELEETLRGWGMLYGGIPVKNTHSIYLARVNEDKQYDEIFTFVALLLLFISPLIWFFSQMLYYYKREGEFTILQSVGALESDIKRLYIFGGIFMGVLSFIFCILLGYSLSFLLYKFVNVFVPHFSGLDLRFSFYMPWYAILVSVIMSVSCGFLSAFLPYRSFMRRRSKTLFVEYAEVSE